MTDQNLIIIFKQFPLLLSFIGGYLLCAKHSHDQLNAFQIEISNLKNQINKTNKNLDNHYDTMNKEIISIERDLGIIRGILSNRDIKSGVI